MSEILPDSISTLAQANAAPGLQNVTLGEALSGMMVLITMTISLAMVAVWTVRMQTSGHVLPAARRGILRVPRPLTIVAIAMCILLLMLAAAVVIEDWVVPAVPGTASEAATEVEPESTAPGNNATTTLKDPAKDADHGDTATDAQSAAKAETQTSSNIVPAKTHPRLSPEKIRSALVQTIIMNVLLLVTFGTVVLISNLNGRVRLASAGRGNGSTSWLATKTDATVPAPLRPELDTASPVQREVGVFSGTTAGETTHQNSSWFGETASAESYPPLALENSLHNPWDGDRSASLIGEEPFSLLTELRFAGEVFLAAYLPTTVFRLIIVMISIKWLGEAPGQHPFLEMLEAGVTPLALTLILLTAIFFAPVVEELQFRVVILGGLTQIGHPLAALTLSSLLFAFAHEFPDSVALLPLAFALGYAYLRRRSYITVMLVHLLFNSFNMVLALLALL